MVTVQLVDSKVKRKPGTPMVTILMTQYKSVDMRLRIARMKRPKKPSQLEGSWAATTCVAELMTAEMELLGDSIASTTLWETLLAI
jgi:hypothetical protein